MYACSETASWRHGELRGGHTACWYTLITGGLSEFLVHALVLHAHRRCEESVISIVHKFLFDLLVYAYRRLRKLSSTYLIALALANLTKSFAKGSDPFRQVSWTLRAEQHIANGGGDATH